MTKNENKTIKERKKQKLQEDKQARCCDRKKTVKTKYGIVVVGVVLFLFHIVFIPTDKRCYANIEKTEIRQRISYNVTVGIEEKIQHLGEDKRKIYVKQLEKLLQKFDKKTNTYQLINDIKNRVANVKKIPIDAIDKKGKRNILSIVEWYQKDWCNEGYLPTTTGFVAGKVFFGGGINPLVYEDIYILGTIVNVGDLDGDGIDEVQLTDNRCRGNRSFFSLYSYKKGKWQKLGNFNVYRGMIEEGENEGKYDSPYEKRVKIIKKGLVEIYEDGRNDSQSEILIRKANKYKVENGKLKLYSK